MEDENTQLKKHKAMLKNALQTSIRENEQLLEINQDLEKKLKLQNEHIDALTLLNQQLQKRCENLQEDNKAKANNSWTWGLWKSKSTSKLEDLAQCLSILEEDLRCKIEENEQVHMKNFEQKEKYRAKKTEFKETVSKKDEMIRNISHQIEDMTLLINSLKTQVQIFSKENTELTTLIQSKNKELQEFQANFHKVNTTYKEKTSSLENKIKQKISLDDAGYEYLTSYNAPKFNYQYNQKQNEWISKAKSSLLQVLPHITEILSKYDTRLHYLYENSSPCYRRILSEFKAKFESFLESFSACIVEISSEKLDINKSIKSIHAVSKNYKNLLSVFVLQLEQEGKWVEDDLELNSLNAELIDSLKKIDNFISRGLAFIIASAYGKHSSWDYLQDLAKDLVLCIAKASNFWGKRLALDTKIRYNITVKSTRSINDEILGSLQALCSITNHILSALLQLKSNLYYNTSQLYFNSVNYLAHLREQTFTPGIEYTKAIQNIQDLKLSERKIDEQRLQIQSLEKELAESISNTTKANNQVRELENLIAAVEQNLDQKADEIGKSIFEETEIISEDVKNGVQRVALRLTDSQGEAVPISSLKVENDLYEKIKEVAVIKINQLAEKMNSELRFAF